MSKPYVPYSTQRYRDRESSVLPIKVAEHSFQVPMPNSP